MIRTDFITSSFELLMFNKRLYFRQIRNIKMILYVFQKRFNIKCVLDLKLIQKASVFSKVESTTKQNSGIYISTPILSRISFIYQSYPFSLQRKSLARFSLSRRESLHINLVRFLNFMKRFAMVSVPLSGILTLIVCLPEDTCG